MKKFLTVLLVIAVMFTFSFGSAFAVEAGTVVATKAEAVKAITDKIDGYVADINTDLPKVISEYSDYQWAANVSKAAYTTVVTELAEEAIANMQKVKVEALNALEAAEKKAADANDDVILGYVVKTGSVDAGYVNVVGILDTIKDPTFAETNFGDAKYDVRFLEEEFDLVKANTQAAINAIDLSVYSTTADSDNDGTKDYAEAVEARRDALIEVNEIKLVAGENTAKMLEKIAAVKDVFHVTNKGTTDEALAGKLGTFLNGLKKTTVEVTDSKKAEYAQATISAMVKPVIEAKKAAEIKVQNELILAQELSAKPNQKKIDAANEEIEKITAKYDAMLEVWSYRLANADYVVEKAANTADTNEYVYTYYNNAKYNKLNEGSKAVGYFTANVWNAYGIYTALDIHALESVLSAEDALKIAKAVDALEEDAATLKATIEVDGNVSVEVDEALADAIDETYMTGALNVVLDPATVNSVAHERIHDLLGKDGVKITVDGNKYPTVNAWDDNLAAYDATKAAEVKTVVADATAALKDCATVAEADAAFLAAYAEFDAIMTDAEHDLMFVYGGELYEAYAKAVAEINAYIGYKADLMDDTYPATNGYGTTTLKDYFTGGDGVGTLHDDVYSAADLEAKVAEAKATIDSLKTKKELKEEDSALAKKVLAVSVPVTAAAKDEVVALFKEIKAFDAYCDMVGYVNTTTEETGLIQTYVDNLAAIEAEAIKDMKAAIDKDGKIKLDEKEAVEALAVAVDAYNDLYVDDLKNVTEAQTSAAYEDKIFDLEVEAAEKLIAALPVNAAAADVAAARAAVDALGFDGICKINPTLLTKLNKFEQDKAVQTIYSVETLKITARSSAKKGSITVKWDVEGDTDAVEAYEIWKSTKHSSGYKKAFTTEKMSYKNTKGLKKGTRYYYKVRAIAYVEGEKIKSDWSNKARRIAK